MQNALNSLRKGNTLGGRHSTVFALADTHVAECAWQSSRSVVCTRQNARGNRIRRYACCKMRKIVALGSMHAAACGEGHVRQNALDDTHAAVFAEGMRSAIGA
ncbi:hypothetical protein AMTR_s00087p00133490 [Amborella trichopoda]|uniref:Uncharacterized protein n=1 Tax=Amborella trichopoda TaxID=13333 RepID=W1P4L4_AMBTC|nr:hypothetical protein AMTR_s00087p00133490 [Amborella trichopoda]